MSTTFCLEILLLKEFKRLLKVPDFQKEIEESINLEKKYMSLLFQKDEMEFFIYPHNHKLQTWCYGQELNQDVLKWVLFNLRVHQFKTQKKNFKNLLITVNKTLYVLQNFNEFEKEQMIKNKPLRKTSSHFRFWSELARMGVEDLYLWHYFIRFKKFLREEENITLKEILEKYFECRPDFEDSRNWTSLFLKTLLIDYMRGDLYENKTLL